MEINTNLNTGGVSGANPPGRPASPARPAGNGVSFASSEALDKALKSLPDSRQDAVERAKALVNDPSYPSSDTLKKLSQFLAANLSATEE